MSCVGVKCKICWYSLELIELFVFVIIMMWLCSSVLMCGVLIVMVLWLSKFLRLMFCICDRKFCFGISVVSDGSIIVFMLVCMYRVVM